MAVGCFARWWLLPVVVVAMAIVVDCWKRK